MTRDVASALRDGAAALRAAGIEEAALEARRLLAHAMEVDQATLLRNRAAPVPARFNGLLARRVAHEPLAFIVGRQGFWTLDLEVSPETLIPRADSETLVQAVLEARPERGCVKRVLDLGTGTGCLLLAVLSEYPAAWGVGVDVAPHAAALAARNARANRLGQRSAFVMGDWAASLAASPQACFDVVLSNPPYIRRADIAGLMPEVSAFEPWGALDGGVDGLVAYRALLPHLARLLSDGGLAVLELGEGQAEEVSGLARAAGFTVALRADLAGTWRAAVLEKTVGMPGEAH